jgi:hypothetical protein
VALALVLTIIEVGLFDVEMRREAARIGHVPPDRVLHVDLIEEQWPVAPPVVVEIPPLLRLPAPVQHRTRPRVVQRETPRESPQATPSDEKPRLFGLDGHVLLPDQPAGSGGVPTTFPQGGAHGDALARTNPVPYVPTRFDRYWPDLHETLGDEVWRKTTVAYSWITPWGTRFVCKSNLLLLGVGGCGWGRHRG